MGRWSRNPLSPRNRAPLVVLIAAAVAAATYQPACGVIFGGTGNHPRDDPGWPDGAAEVFNTPARVASWEGPPLGGGQSHAECRGNAQALSAVLADFAKVDGKSKRVVLHDGVGSSFWLNPNRDAAKRESAKIDWVFMVWQKASWERQRKMPPELVPPDVAADAADEPPMRIDVYTGGNVRWSEVVVPQGIEVTDERLEAHGFTADDGLVLEGNAFDLATRQPLAARITLERMEPQAQGGYRYTAGSKAVADADGRWALKKVSADWQRIVVESDGYVPRIVGYIRVDQPGWHRYECGLSRPASVTGRVSDMAGKPLAGVNVRLSDVIAGASGRYESPSELTTETNAVGRFRIDSVPIGTTRIGLHKSGYCRPGLGQVLETPVADIKLEMVPAASIRITVDFAEMVRPAAYIVELKPEAGEAVGKWSGSALIDVNNQVEFNNVPPDRYVVVGRPNPAREGEQSGPFPLDLKGGEDLDVELTVQTDRNPAQ